MLPVEPHPRPAVRRAPAPPTPVSGRGLRRVAGAEP
ncbi:hypothetical protein J2S46_000715 [Kitasatospora herbaricolor]|nr:hypothetical protein [Kitasatospora herbaricolor]